VGRKVRCSGSYIERILMKVLVTGGSGFIGHHCLAQLFAKGYEVHGISSVSQVSSPEVQWHQTNLLDVEKTRALVRVIKPSHLLHLAWYTKQGKYWTSSENLSWIQASLALFQEFAESGGERIVGAGSCAEYEWGHGVCVENQTPHLPSTLYGTTKHALQLILNSWSKQSGLSSAWGRVFSLYGPKENPQRLVASVIRALLSGDPVTCANAGLVRDYLHSEDVASAFVALLESGIDGPVNIGSGERITLGEIVKKIADKLDCESLVELRVQNTISSSENDVLIADVTRIALTGWTKKYDLDSGLNQTIDWWRTQQNAGNRLYG